MVAFQSAIRILDAHVSAADRAKRSEVDVPDSKVEAIREAIHHHRRCRVLAGRLAAIASLRFRLGSDREWNHDSDLGECARVCGRGCPCSNAVA